MEKETLPAAEIMLDMIGISQSEILTSKRELGSVADGSGATTWSNVIGRGAPNTILCNLVSSIYFVEVSQDRYTYSRPHEGSWTHHASLCA